ncbi:MAG: F0F1 ATP synthase subunit epsilon [Bacteroidetes bacterium]|nr:MAG: F0F1 ATP synthase subunit epsilon [Bacteroidota bacterium]
MDLTVLTPDMEVFHGSIKSVKVPGTNGQFQVLNNHAPVVSSLEEGDVYIVTGEDEFKLYSDETRELEPMTEADRSISFHIAGGFIEVLNNKVSLLVNGVADIK